MQKCHLSTKIKFQMITETTISSHVFIRSNWEVWTSHVTHITYHIKELTNFYLLQEDASTSCSNFCTTYKSKYIKYRNRVNKPSVLWQHQEEAVSGSSGILPPCKRWKSQPVDLTLGQLGACQGLQFSTFWRDCWGLLSPWTINPRCSYTSGTSEITWRDVQHIRHDYMALRVRVKSRGAQVVFSSILLLKEQRDQGSAWKNSRGNSPRDKSDQGELVDFQGLPPPWMIHLTRRNTRKGGRKTAWVNKELLTKLKHKEKAYKRWRQRQVIQEEYRDIVQGYRGEARKSVARSPDEG